MSGIFGALLILRERDATFGFDGCQTKRSVGAGAGKHHPHGLGFPLLGEGAEKNVDHHAMTIFVRIGCAARPPSCIVRSGVRRDHIDVIGQRRASRPRASITGIRVALENNSLSILLYVLLRWDTSTKAMPVSPGSAFRNSRKASSPPAEAPTPTTGTSERHPDGAGDWLNYSELFGRSFLSRGFPARIFLRHLLRTTKFALERYSIIEFCGRDGKRADTLAAELSQSWKLTQLPSLWLAPARRRSCNSHGPGSRRYPAMVSRRRLETNLDRDALESAACELAAQPPEARRKSLRLQL